MTPLAIAIPARNEADRIGACLRAIGTQPDAARHIAGVIVYANNCTDATAARARAAASGLPVRVDVHAVELPPGRAHIGWARHGAVAAAEALLGNAGVRGGVIALTDADSRVQPGWLAAIVAEFAAGADAVAGSIDLDPAETVAEVPVRLLESRYAAATAELVARLDPLPHDPWPNHIWAWGANLAIRADMLAAVGGMPIVDLAEDRALHAALLRHDARVRHSLAARVWTSARTDGRAPGGLADLLNDYRSRPQSLCDIALEPAAMTARRAAWRARLRRLHAAGDGFQMARLRGVPPRDTAHFGALWEAVEAGEPALARQRLRLAELPGQIAAIDRRLATLRAAAAADRADIAVSRSPRPAPQMAQSLR